MFSTWIYFCFQCVNSVYWVLVTVSPTNKAFIYYDSMYGNKDAVRTKIFRFMKVRCQTQTGQLLNVTKWTLKDEKSVPRLTNTIDCEVFICQIAERLSRSSSIDFNQTQMPAIRNHMIEHIVAGVISIATPPQVISPPRSDDENIVQRPGRFDMPPSERIKRLEAEFRKLRAQFAAQESSSIYSKKMPPNNSMRPSPHFGPRPKLTSRNCSQSCPKRTTGSKY